MIEERNNADILAALQRDVAAAAPRPWTATEGWIDDAHNADLLSSEGAFYSHADARLAALDGPALLAALMDIVYTDGFPHHVPSCGSCKGCRAMLVVADAGKALGCR